MAAEAAAAAGASRLRGAPPPPFFPHPRPGTAAAPALRGRLPRSPPAGPASAPASAPPVTLPAVPRRGQAPGPFPPTPPSGGVGFSQETWPLPPRRLPSRACARRRVAAGFPGGRPASAVTQVGAGAGWWWGALGKAGRGAAIGVPDACVFRGEGPSVRLGGGPAGAGEVRGSLGIQEVPGLGAAGAPSLCGWREAAVWVVI